MSLKTKKIKQDLGNNIVIIQKISKIGQKKNQIKTLIALGLGKINRTKVVQDSPSVRGMINKVKHLVEVRN